MISYFPQIYEDELLYSVLARFHIHSGYLFFENTKDALFTNKETTPIIEFINMLKPDVVDALTKNMSMEDVILKHTMFPYYARFYSDEKKRNAINSLINMESDIGKTVSKKYNKRYLRYCPLCAKEDRESKGEAIWYRKHQIVGVSVCPVHGCVLVESNIPISRDVRISYTTAEQEADKGIEIKEGTELEKAFSIYISKLLNSVMHNNSNVADFIKKKVAVSDRDMFYQRLCKFYSGDEFIMKHMNKNSIIKVLNGNNDNALKICCVAFYCGITIDELIGSYENVCSLERKKKILPYKAKPKNYWKDRDEEVFAMLNDVIKQLNGDKITLPQRICVSSIERRLGFHKGTMKSMKKCLEYLKDKVEDSDTFHAKRALWAIERLKEEGKQITWAQINVKSHIMYHYKDACLNKLSENADEELLQIIDSIR